MRTLPSYYSSYKLVHHVARRIYITCMNEYTRLSKMIPEPRDLSYEERLKECGLTHKQTYAMDKEVNNNNKMTSLAPISSRKVVNRWM